MHCLNGLPTQPKVLHVEVLLVSPRGNRGGPQLILTWGIRGAEGIHSANVAITDVVTLRISLPWSHYLEEVKLQLSLGDSVEAGLRTLGSKEQLRLS